MMNAILLIIICMEDMNVVIMAFGAKNVFHPIAIMDIYTAKCIIILLHKRLFLWYNNFSRKVLF